MRALTYIAVWSLFSCSSPPEPSPPAPQVTEPSTGTPPEPYTTTTEPTTTTSFEPTAACYAAARSGGPACFIELNEPDLAFFGVSDGYKYNSAFAFGDVTGDGHVDFLGASQTEPFISVIEGPLSGEYHLPEQASWLKEYSNFYDSAVYPRSPTPLSIGDDYTGDGVVNVVLHNAVYNSPFTPGEPDLLAYFECPVFGIADVTGDGVRDLYEHCRTTHYVHSGAEVGAGGGRLFGFDAGQPEVIGDLHTVVSDLNDDGFDDLLLAYTTTPGDSYWYYNTCSVILSGGDQTLPVVDVYDNTAPLLHTVYSPNVQHNVGGDFNGDGFGDLAASTGTSCRVYFGPFPERWSPLHDILSIPNPPYFDLTNNELQVSGVTSPGDLDGDGADELICAFGGDSQPLEIHMVDTAALVGSFTVNERSIWMLSTENSPENTKLPHSLQMVDYNADGVLDLALVNESGGYYDNVGEVLLIDGTRF